MASTQIRGSQILDGSITAADIADGTIKDADIAADAAISFSKLSGVAAAAASETVGTTDTQTLTNKTLDGAVLTNMTINCGNAA